MFKKIGIVVNLLGTFVWFFNYIIFSTNICLFIGLCQLFLAAFVLTEDYRTGRIRK